MNMNYSVFLLSTLLTAIPVPFTFRFTGHISLIPAFALIGLGLITGVSFLIYAEALKRVSFLFATVISNSCVIFTFVWANLFYKETINSYIGAGVVIMLIGLILIVMPRRGKAGAKAAVNNGEEIEMTEKG
jgi:drug/metabolite transporter (DMT)-like permease